MRPYRKLAVGSLVFAALSVLLMLLCISFVRRLPPSLHGTWTDWVYMSLVGLFAMVAVLYCVLAFGLAFRVIEAPSASGAPSWRLLRRLTGFYVPGGNHVDLLLVVRAGGLWLVPTKPERPPANVF